VSPVANLQQGLEKTELLAYRRLEKRNRALHLGFLVQGILKGEVSLYC
jgi:hypothetical protein